VEDERPVQRAFISPRSNSPRITQDCRDEGDVHGTPPLSETRLWILPRAPRALAASAQAAPLVPQPITGHGPPGNDDARPAVATGDEVDRVAPEEVRWGRGRGHHRGWGPAALGLAQASLGLASPPPPATGAAVTGVAATGKG